MITRAEIQKTFPQYPLNEQTWKEKNTDLLAVSLLAVAGIAYGIFTNSSFISYLIYGSIFAIACAANYFLLTDGASNLNNSMKAAAIRINKLEQNINTIATKAQKDTKDFNKITTSYNELKTKEEQLTSKFKEAESQKRALQKQIIELEEEIAEKETKERDLLNTSLLATKNTRDVFDQIKSNVEALANRHREIATEIIALIPDGLDEILLEEDEEHSLLSNSFSISPTNTEADWKESFTKEERTELSKQIAEIVGRIHAFIGETSLPNTALSTLFKGVLKLLEAIPEDGAIEKQNEYVVLLAPLFFDVPNLRTPSSNILLKTTKGPTYKKVDYSFEKDTSDNIEDLTKKITDQCKFLKASPPKEVEFKEKIKSLVNSLLTFCTHIHKIGNEADRKIILGSLLDPDVNFSEIKQIMEKDPVGKI